jgi:tetratricopeptide (TPR) repeat protein
LLICFQGFIYNPVFSANIQQTSFISKKPIKASVDGLLSKSRLMKDSDPGKGIELARLAFKVADSIRYDEGFIKASVLYSEFLLQTGTNDSAKIILNGLLDKYGSKLQNRQYVEFWVFRGITYYEMGSYDTAMSNYKTAFEIVPDETELNEITAPIFTNRANVYGVYGEYSKAVEDYMKVARFYEENNIKAPLAQIYINIGAELRNLNEFTKSIEYYTKAATINEKIGNNRGLAQCYANMGVSYKEMDSIDLAIEYYEKSLEIAEKTNSTLFIAQNKLNLGNIYEKAGRYEDAINSFNSSLEICVNSGVEYGIMLNYLNLGHVNWLAKNFDSSEDYYRKALAKIREMKLPKEEYQALERMAKLNADQGYFKHAYQNLMLGYTLKDSIQSMEQKQYILDLEKKYETEKKELAIAQLEKKGLNQRLIILLLITAALILLILVQRVYLKNKITKRDQLIVQQESVLLQSKLDSKNRELSNVALQVVEMQLQLQDTNDKLKEIINRSVDKNHPIFREILNWLKTNYVKHSLLKGFENQLADSNKDFYSRLLTNFPDLTPTELKICAMLRLNLSTKEIALLLTRSIRTIDFTRNSIRKKLKLGIQDNLQTFLMSVQPEN